MDNIFLFQNLQNLGFRLITLWATLILGPSISLALSTNFVLPSKTEYFLAEQQFPTHKFYSESQPFQELEQRARNPLKRITPEDLPFLIPDGDLELFKRALKLQIKRCQKLPANKTWTFDQRIVTRKVWCTRTAKAFLQLANQSTTTADLWEKAKNYFEWYKSMGLDQKGGVHYTGYYLPLINGAKSPDYQNRFAIYKKPNDLVRVLIGGKYRWRRKNPNNTYSFHFNRYEIDWEMALSNQQLEMVHVDDQIEVFFLHIQGSGVVMVKQKNGPPKRTFFNYAAQNGHRYVAIGRILKKEGVDKSYLSLQGLRRYFRERPEEIDRIFPMNPSYIFFYQAQQGPYGSGGTLLSNGHSIATDNRIYPLGAVALISCQRPETDDIELDDWIPFTRLTVNQDTGGAIKGPGRVYIYWGEGSYADKAAGGQNHMGELYFALIPAD